MSVRGELSHDAEELRENTPITLEDPGSNKQSEVDMRLTTVRVPLLALVGVLLWSPAARADEVNSYVFSGAGGLAGAFTLDASTMFTITDGEGSGTGYQL